MPTTYICRLEASPKLLQTDFLNSCVKSSKTFMELGKFRGFPRFWKLFQTVPSRIIAMEFMFQTEPWSKFDQNTQLSLGTFLAIMPVVSTVIVSVACTLTRFLSPIATTGIPIYSDLWNRTVWNSLEQFREQTEDLQNCWLRKFCSWEKYAFNTVFASRQCAWKRLVAK